MAAGVTVGSDSENDGAVTACVSLNGAEISYSCWWEEVRLCLF